MANFIFVSNSFLSSVNFDITSLNLDSLFSDEHPYIYSGVIGFGKAFVFNKYPFSNCIFAF